VSRTDEDTPCRSTWQELTDPFPLAPGLSSALEVLHRAFVLLGLCPGIKRAEVLSSSRFCAADSPLPARLMKYWIMRIADPGPLRLTFLLAMIRAIVVASSVKVPSGGNVDTVLTL
jgi:hypothetical protein